MHESLYKQIVCLNGHQYTDRADRQEKVSGYCPECGAKLIDSCPNCHTIINGYVSYDWVVDFLPHKVSVPKYCEKCSQPYPWTKASIEALKELVQSSDLRKKDKSKLTESIPSLIEQGPRTSLAVHFWRTIGKPILKVARDVFEDVLSEAIVKALYRN